MEIQVTVEGQTFQVRVDNLSDRPIVAVVDGERFEVWPDGGGASIPAPVAASLLPAAPAASTAPATTRPPAPAAPQAPTGKGFIVRAPIPGVIVAINVEAGQQVQPGAELCVLEAMKMRNAIRAACAGQIARVHVAVGQHVKHQDVLVEFAD